MPGYGEQRVCVIDKRKHSRRYKKKITIDLITRTFLMRFQAESVEAE